ALFSTTVRPRARPPPFPTRRSSDLSHVHDPVHKREATAFFLHQGSKGDAIVRGGGVYIHRPARIGIASVHVQRINKMFLSCTIEDRKSTRLNSSHGSISYAVFCLRK